MKISIRDPVARPSPGALLFGLIPFVSVCFSVAWWDRLYPVVLGLPFNLFWLILWMLLTPLCMWGAYRQEQTRSKRDHRSRNRA